MSYGSGTICFEVLQYVMLRIYSAAFPYICSVLPALLCNISRNVLNYRVTQSDLFSDFSPSCH